MKHRITQVLMLPLALYIYTFNAIYMFSHTIQEEVYFSAFWIVCTVPYVCLLEQAAVLSLCICSRGGVGRYGWIICIHYVKLHHFLFVFSLSSQGGDASEEVGWSSEINADDLTRVASSSTGNQRRTSLSSHPSEGRRTNPRVLSISHDLNIFSGTLDT